MSDVVWTWFDVFACRPCECGGMCDKCRQTPLREPESPLTSEDGPKRRGVCLCGPDTEYDVGDEGWETRRGPTKKVGGGSGDGQVTAVRDARSTPQPRLTISGRVSEPSPSPRCRPCLCDPDTDAVCDRNCA